MTADVYDALTREVRVRFPDLEGGLQSREGYTQEL